MLSATSTAWRKEDSAFAVSPAASAMSPAISWAITSACSAPRGLSEFASESWIFLRPSWACFAVSVSPVSAALAPRA